MKGPDEILEPALDIGRGRPTRGEPEEAFQRVLSATWQKLSDFQTLLAINTSRLSAKELHRRHQPVMTQFVPLIERGQEKGVFRSDVPVSWHLAMIRAIAHAASAEVRSGRIPASEVEPAMLTTAVAAISPPVAPERSGLSQCSGP